VYPTQRGDVSTMSQSIDNIGAVRRSETTYIQMPKSLHGRKKFLLLFLCVRMCGSSRMTGSASLCEQHCDDRHFHGAVVLTSKSRRLSHRTQHTAHGSERNGSSLQDSDRNIKVCGRTIIAPKQMLVLAISFLKVFYNSNSFRVCPDTNQRRRRDPEACDTVAINSSPTSKKRRDASNRLPA
jgi:hypothetical protein